MDSKQKSNLLIKKIGVLTSGGDAPGMNACVRAVVRTALSYGMEVYGIHDGYKGLVNNDIEKLTHRSVSNLLDRGGTFLGTARLDAFKDIEVCQKAVDNLKKLGIEALVCIGGDGTYMGALRLTEMGINCIGVPGTIDNDISSTEFTIGFDTCLNTIVDSLDRIRDTAASHSRCMVIEVMGRFCPDLAIRASMCAGVEIVITKKEDYNPRTIIEQINKFKAQKKRFCLIVVAEHTVNIDAVAQYIDVNCDAYEARAEVLGHIQRGGKPSAFDRVLATRLGAYAVELINAGQKGICVGNQGDHLGYMTIEKSCSLPKKTAEDILKESKILV